MTDKREKLSGQLTQRIKEIAYSVDKTYVEVVTADKIEKVINKKSESLCKICPDEVQVFIRAKHTKLSDEYAITDLLKDVLGNKISREFRRGVEEIILIILFAGKNGIYNLGLDQIKAPHACKELNDMESTLFKSLKS